MLDFSSPKSLMSASVSHECCGLGASGRTWEQKRKEKTKQRRAERRAQKKKQKNRAEQRREGKKRDLKRKATWIGGEQESRGRKGTEGIQ